MADDLGQVLRYADGLPEVGQVYNTGLIVIQWHLIYRQAPPSSFCEVEESDGRVTSLRRLGDDDKVEPPPFKTIQFEIPDSSEITRIDVCDEWQSPIASFKGAEANVLGDFQRLIRYEDPDVIVISSPITTKRHVLHRAACRGRDFRFGRGGENFHGRVLVGLSECFFVWPRGMLILSVDLTLGDSIVFRRVEVIEEISWFRLSSSSGVVCS